MSGIVSAHTGFAHMTDLPCWQLRFGNACATITSYGAQVLSYQPEPDKELLWLSPLANWHDKHAIRGGIPVCWPWFGPADSKVIPHAASQPNHGVVRTRLWQLHAIEQNHLGCSVTLKSSMNTLPHCASPVTLYLKLTLNATLTIELRCDSIVPQQAALHSYFSVANCTEVEIYGLSKHYVDKVSNSPQQHHDDRARINTETDRVYQDPSAVMTIDDHHVKVQVAQTGQDHAVLWNPWQHKSLLMADIPNQGYLHFICLESARLSWRASSLLLSQTIRLD